MGFEPDYKIQQIAEAYALDAVDLARERFRVTLDWSDSSVQDIESILRYLHEQMQHAKPSADRVLQFAKIFGSYVGEVFKRNPGASWGTVSLGNDRFPGMQAERTEVEFWPWGRAQKRLISGPEENVWHYFQTLVAENGSPDTTP